MAITDAGLTFGGLAKKKPLNRAIQGLFGVFPLMKR